MAEANAAPNFSKAFPSFWAPASVRRLTSSACAISSGVLDRDDVAGADQAGAAICFDPSPVSVICHTTRYVYSHAGIPRTRLLLYSSVTPRRIARMMDYVVCAHQEISKMHRQPP